MKPQVNLPSVNHRRDQAILVHVDTHDSHNQDYINEFSELVLAADIEPVVMIKASNTAPEAKYFVGTGKAQEIQSQVQANQANLVIINHELSPAQQRNLERLVKCVIWDRTELIIHIFAKRARTFEGKLQVELARLQHMATRLVRGWTHLERQKGGIGLRGGPGETQLEVDRRLIRNRIKSIKERLQKVKQQRDLSRRARKRASIFTVSLVGYTNAGKSTLFNYLTEAKVYVADQLFATLDPTLRRIHLPTIGEVILADTVGFIRDLPHQLIEAFHATLEETLEADILLHVVDAHSEEREDYINQVNKVIKEIGADEIPQLLVFNKLDLMSEQQPRIDRLADGKPLRVWLSAISGEGIDLLQQALTELLSQETVYEHIALSANEAKLRAALYTLGAVLTEREDENGGCILSIRLSRDDYQRLLGSR